MKCKRIFIKGLTVFSALLIASAVHASGTPAGTVITNTATATFDMDSVTGFTVTSNETTTVVAEVIDVTVTWQDTPGVTVNPGDKDRVLTYLVTNTGNGPQAFTLTSLSTIPGGDFDLDLVGIYLDDGDGAWGGRGAETPYTPGVNEPLIPAGGQITVFVLNNIPLGLADGDEGLSNLTATTLIGSGAPGTVFAGQGVGGVDAVIGNSGGEDDDTGKYVVSGLDMQVVKSYEIVDNPFGGTSPVPGATIRFTLTVEVVGSGIARNVELSDDIPDNTTYVADSLWLNGATNLTDQAGDDDGEVVGNTVTVRLGDLEEADPVQTITFDTMID